MMVTERKQMSNNLVNDQEYINLITDNGATITYNIDLLCYECGVDFTKIEVTQIESLTEKCLSLSNAADRNLEEIAYFLNGKLVAIGLFNDGALSWISFSWVSIEAWQSVKDHLETLVVQPKDPIIKFLDNPEAVNGITYNIGSMNVLDMKYHRFGFYKGHKVELRRVKKNIRIVSWYILVNNRRLVIYDNNSRLSSDIRNAVDIKEISFPKFLSEAPLVQSDQF